MKRIYTYMCLLLLSVLSFAVTGCDDDDDDDEFRDMWRRGGEGFGERRGVRGTGRYAGEYRRRRR